MDKVDTSKERALQIQDKLQKYKEEYFVPHGHLYFSAH
jgi:DNA polymerase IIIc chi subunit